MDRVAAQCAVVGVIASGRQPDRTLSRPPRISGNPICSAYIFWSGLALGCLGIFLLHNVVGGNWGVAIRRFVESGLQTLPLFALVVIPILLRDDQRSIPGPIPIVRAHDFAVGHKAAYMNVPFFIGRTVFISSIWFFFGLAHSENGQRARPHRRSSPVQAHQRRQRAGLAGLRADHHAMPSSTGSCRSSPTGIPPSTAGCSPSAKFC